MVDKLRAVIEQAEKLSDEAQEALAEAWEQQLADATWDATLSQPKSLATLDKLVARAKEQVARGEVFDSLRDRSCSI